MRLKIILVIAIFFAPAQVLIGHGSVDQIYKYQPSLNCQQEVAVFVHTALVFPLTFMGLEFMDFPDIIPPPSPFTKLHLLTVE